MSVHKQAARFYRSMETLEIGDVLVCERDGMKQYALIKWSYENRTLGQYELSGFGPCMDFRGSRTVSLNYSGWLQDLRGEVILGCEEWRYTLKGAGISKGAYSLSRSHVQKKEPVIRILFVGSKSFREEAEIILKHISEGKMSKDEAVNFLRRVLFEK